MATFFPGLDASDSKSEIGFDKGDGVPKRLLGSEEPRGGTFTELDWCRLVGGGEGLLGLARCEADSCLDEDGLVAVLLEDTLPALLWRSWFDTGRPEVACGFVSWTAGRLRGAEPIVALGVDAMAAA